MRAFLKRLAEKMHLLRQLFALVFPSSTLSMPLEWNLPIQRATDGILFPGLTSQRAKREKWKP
jgi:hypothetical protein